MTTVLAQSVAGAACAAGVTCRAGSPPGNGAAPGRARSYDQVDAERGGEGARRRVEDLVAGGAGWGAPAAEVRSMRNSRERAAVHTSR